MKLIPLLTEKSIAEAKKGNYTFIVDHNLTKHEIKRAIDETFDVHVKNVRSMNIHGEEKTTYQGKKKRIMPKKKAIITLPEKEKIDLFEEKKK